MPHPSRPWAGVAIVAVGAALGGACSASSQKEVTSAALDATNEGQRHTLFEGTVRALDEHPAYVDELYAVARAHPATMQRFLANAVRDLKEPELASTTAELITKEPASLEAMMERLADRVQNDAEARAAFTRAVEKKATVLADMITDRPSATVAMLVATTKRVQAKPKARPAFYQGVRETAPILVAMLKEDDGARKDLTKVFLKESVKDKAVLDQVLTKLGLVD